MHARARTRAADRRAPLSQQARTALFSLGNLASHACAHARLLELDLPAALQPLAALGDATVDKYAARVLSKLAHE